MIFNLEFLTIQSVLSFLLALFRVQAFFSVAPIFSKKFPAMIKVGLSAVIVIWFYETIFTNATTIIPSDVYGLTAAIIHEVLIGFLFGLLVNMIFDAIVTFAHLLGIQMGQSSASIFNPATGSSNNTTAVLFGTVTLMIFLTIGGLHHILFILRKTFELIPLASFNLDFVAFTQNYQGIFSEMFFLALKLILPIIAFMFVFDIFIAIFSRILPQASMFFLFMPIKIILGSFVIITVLGFYYSNINNYFTDGIYTIIDNIFR